MLLKVPDIFSDNTEFSVQGVPVCSSVGGGSAGDCGGSQTEGVPGGFPNSGVSASGRV